MKKLFVFLMFLVLINSSCFHEKRYMGEVPSLREGDDGSYEIELLIPRPDKGDTSYAILDWQGKLAVDTSRYYPLVTDSTLEIPRWEYIDEDSELKDRSGIKRKNLKEYMGKATHIRKFL